MIIKNKLNIDVIRSWYGRYERPISSLSLILGFVFDAVTLERIDKVWDNFWVLSHILIVAIFMVLVHSTKREEGDEADPGKRHFWFVNILQFFFGGLLSVFLVFYFRSSDLSVSWPFLLLLAVAFWANESLKRHFVRLTFQISLFFLSLFSCMIFLVPVLVHQIGSIIFVLSGVISLFIMISFLHVLMKYSEDSFIESRKMIFLSIFSIYVGVNILYFTHLIPPIPLSLKDSGVYHSIIKNEDNYTAQYEQKAGIFPSLYKDIHITPNETIYAYSAVFSPNNLNLDIVHEWKYFDPTYKEWIDAEKIKLHLTGGRQSGFRTYSLKNGLFPGKWKVVVKTSGGQVIGTLRFNIIGVSALPYLKTKTLE